MSESVAQNLGGAGAGFVGRIPVRNLWLLMFYASDLFRGKGASTASHEDAPDEIPELVAEILMHSVENRLRRQLSATYMPRRAVLNRVRGRIDVLATERHQLLGKGLVACSFDDLTIDSPRNRYVRGALSRLGGLIDRKDLAHRCFRLANTMKSLGVGGRVPTRAQMSADRFGRHDADDRLMVAAARLAFDLALPTEEAGIHSVLMPDREERWVRRLFERAVGGFYTVVLEPLGWTVKTGGSLAWQVGAKTAGIDLLLPSMKTDIVLDHEVAGRRIVIDTKFTSIVTSGWYTEETFRSGYLYQIYAYLFSQVGAGDSLANRAEGLLLHPSTGVSVDEVVEIQGHSIRFATVDLAAPATEFRRALLRMSASTPYEGNVVRTGVRPYVLNSGFHDKG